ncbi:MAG: hypothetical protein ACYDAY_10615 [Candidatus Dormibacteria bacterium]
MFTSQPSRKLRSAVLAPGLLILGACSFSTASISSADLGTGYDSNSGHATNTASTFQPTDHELHLGVVTANAPDGTTLSCTWYAVNAGGVQNQKIDSTDYTVSGGKGNLDCKLSNTNDWPTGSYRVDLMLNGKLDRSISFTIATSG